MKKNSSQPRNGAGQKPVKKTVVIDCFTGEEREVDPRKIRIVDGMELGNTRVQLDNGVTLTVAGEGKYHTLGNPKERWAEVAQVLVRPDGEYGDGELLGWTPLFSDRPKSASPAKKGPAPAGGAKATGAKKAGPGGNRPNRRPDHTKLGTSAPSGGKLPPRPKKSRT